MPENKNIQLECPKHGVAPYLVTMTGQQILKQYCLVCFDEAMTRLGVHGMFPVAVKPVVVESEPVEWPDELLEVE